MKKILMLVLSMFIGLILFAETDVGLTRETFYNFGEYAEEVGKCEAVKTVPKIDLMNLELAYYNADGLIGSELVGNVEYAKESYDADADNAGGIASKQISLAYI